MASTHAARLAVLVRGTGDIGSAIALAFFTMVTRSVSHVSKRQERARLPVASTRSVRSLYFVSLKCCGCAPGITLTLRLQNARENRAGFRLPVRPFNQRHLSGIGRCPRQTYVASAHD
jgi:hypothetical protein